MSSPAFGDFADFSNRQFERVFRNGLDYYQNFFHDSYDFPERGL